MLGVSRGLLGVAGFVLGLDVDAVAETVGRGAGGGRTGVVGRPRPSRRAFFKA